MIVVAEIACDGKRMKVRLPRARLRQKVRIPGDPRQWTVIKIDHIFPNKK